MNNDAATANVMPGQTGSFCGSVSASDVDYVKFTLPQTAKQLNISYASTSAQVTVEASADGTPFPLSGTLPFMAGKDYVFKFSGAGAADYALNITIAP